jgi:endonuclease YncB( thermonuclease family)
MEYQGEAGLAWGRSRPAVPPRRCGRRPRRGAGCLALVFVAILAAAPAAAREILPGPIPARVLRVIDGDTLAVRARIWLGQEVEVSVRVDGIDAPELKGRCHRERRLARQARALLESHVGGGEVVLRRIRYGKFAGRVLADVQSPAGEDLGTLLRVAGLAQAYAGGRRATWCEQAGALR